MNESSLNDSGRLNIYSSFKIKMLTLYFYVFILMYPKYLGINKKIYVPTRLDENLLKVSHLLHYIKIYSYSEKRSVQYLLKFTYTLTTKKTF